jgi:hypothetical protein
MLDPGNDPSRTGEVPRIDEPDLERDPPHPPTLPEMAPPAHESTTGMMPVINDNPHYEGQDISAPRDSDTPAEE